MKYTIFSLVILLVYQFMGSDFAKAQQNQDQKDNLARFFHVPLEVLSLECPQHSYAFKQDGPDDILEICLYKTDAQKRCEISIADLESSPSFNSIDFDVNFADATKRSEWESIMQIHSFPDKGEKWRCPIAALEIQDGKFRMFNRWDKNPVSQVSGNNCTEPGSSISSRPVLKDAPLKPWQWQHVQLQSEFSYENGQFQLSVDDVKSPLLTGPNSYNDAKSPFIKFGIYKPTSWEPGHDKSCVNYRNVNINVKK